MKNMHPLLIRSGEKQGYGKIFSVAGSVADSATKKRVKVVDKKLLI